MTDNVLAILSFIISGMSICLSGWTIYTSRQTMKTIKRIREGRP